MNLIRKVMQLSVIASTLSTSICFAEVEKKDSSDQLEHFSKNDSSSSEPQSISSSSASSKKMQIGVKATSQKVNLKISTNKALVSNKLVSEIGRAGSVGSIETSHDQ